MAQELMRHSDPHLTAQIYTDVSQLPTFDTVSALPWQSEKAPQNPQIDPQNLDKSGHGQSYAVANLSAIEVTQTP